MHLAGYNWVPTWMAVVVKEQVGDKGCGARTPLLFNQCDGWVKLQLGLSYSCKLHY